VPQSGAGNLLSQHRDFTEYGIAYEVVAIDHPLTPEQLEQRRKERWEKASPLLGALLAKKQDETGHE
jgi:hypothetical protein